MARGKITINTDIANEVVAGLNSASTTLESDILGKLSGFEVLIELGFITNCLPKIKEQATSLANSEKEISASISKHLSSVVQAETKLKNDYKNRSAGGGSYYISSVASGGSQDVEEVLDDSNLKKTEQVLISLTDENKIKLIRFINFYKDKNISLIELLFNKERSKDLFVLLKKAVSGSVDLGELSLEEMEYVQKYILDMIMTSNLDYKELNDSSIIMCKEYLTNVANKYKINPSDLIFDDRYSHVYKRALINLYNGDTENKVSDENINKFRDKVDTLAKEKNMSSYQLIVDNSEVLL